MTRAEKVAKYIHGIFDLYGFNDYGFFCDTRDGEPYDVVPVKLFKSGKIEEGVLARVSLETGFTREELVSLDENVKKKYLKKFPFFKYIQEYTVMLDWDEKYKESPEEHILKAIFFMGEEGYTNGYDGGIRYKDEDIINRLKRQLKAMNQLFPGMWHESAELVDVHWFTDVLTYYPSSKLLKSFFQAVDRLEELFFKALKTDLHGEDASDFNFLTSGLRALDKIHPILELNSETIKRLRPIYNREGYTDLMSYLRINVFNEREPWRCVDFLTNWELAQRYLNYHREGKKAFVEFARTVSKIHCYYYWSDDVEKYQRTGEIPEDMAGYVSNEIYLDKKPEELKGWESSIELLSIAAASEAKGGLKAPHHECDPYRMPFSMRTEKALERSAAVKGISDYSTYYNTAALNQLKEIEKRNREKYPEDYDENGMRIIPDYDDEERTIRKPYVLNPREQADDNEPDEQDDLFDLLGPDDLEALENFTLEDLENLDFDEDDDCSDKGGSDHE